MSIYGKFYNPTKLLSYGRPNMMSIGARSIGKSTGWAIHLLRDFLDNGHQWIYCRWTDNELAETAEHYFDSAAEIVNQYYNAEHVVEYRKREYYVDGELAGYAIPLRFQHRAKSANLSAVWWILNDEAIPMPGAPKPIGYNSAYDMLVSLHQTVDRGIGSAYRNEARIITIGNAGSYYNPYFIGCGADKYLRPDSRYVAPKGAPWVVEQTFEIEATKTIKESNSFAMSSERVREYAYGNKYGDLDNRFVTKKAPGKRRAPVCDIACDGHEYGVWSYDAEGLLYMTDELTGLQKYAITAPDHRPNYWLITSYHGDYVAMMVKQMFDMGLMRFSSPRGMLALTTWFRYDTM